MQTQSRIMIGAVLAALALGGCNNSQPPPATTTTTVNTAPPVATTTTTTATVPGAPDTKINNNAGPGTSNGTDQATADAVNTAIVHNKEMTGSRVDAVVTDGVARLTGTVQNQQQKALAATAASKTPGVTSVVNKLLIDDTGGVHSASTPAPTKIIKQTTIINHYISAPSSSNGSGSGTGTGDSGGGNSPDNSGGDTGTPSGGGSSSTDANGGGSAAPPAPTGGQ